ncbi:SMP-30/gluconolactonase/LRE family protein [Actinokineospora inagensis]|uniref:SMP-30/gluconolactonase/LRE family protein n=1 Tax=Actinokineospora inagensis TaxID=103730 RepID=UPI0004263B98|nr:SMP-30/gluconolactonase/LRE family protein [Actinokineospora inagensis]
MIRPTELAAGMCAGLFGRRVTGPRWDGTRLSWVDTERQRVQLGRMTTLGPRHIATLVVEGSPTAALPAVGGWVLGGDPAFLRRDGRLVPLDLPRSDGLWCDPAGRLWLTADDALHRIDLTGRPHRVLDGPTQALAWSPDTRRMYRVCGGGLLVHEFDLANGTPGAARPLVSAARGVAVDVDGFAWVAGGNSVRRVDHTGVAYTIVRLPGATAVDCCFAGATMLITTDDGAVHACATSTRGLPSVRWTGLPASGRTAAPGFP